MDTEKKSITNELAETKKSNNRKKYMRDYYLKKRHQLNNGKFYKETNKNNKNEFSIKHGEFTISFK